MRRLRQSRNGARPLAFLVKKTKQRAEPAHTIGEGTAMPTSDKALPENSKANLDRKLDHAIEETFPTSDPVSVSITKGGAIDYDSQPEAPSSTRGSLGRERQSTAEKLIDKAKEAVGSTTGIARPLLTLLAGVGIGYALAWMFHSEADEDKRVLEDAESRRSAPPH